MDILTPTHPYACTSPYSYSMADLRHRVARLRVRHLRGPDGAARRRTRHWRADRRQTGLAAVQLLGRPVLLGAGAGRRLLRADRRLPDRPFRPPTRPGVEHPALRVLGACRR